jgi:hypothetical protein
MGATESGRSDGENDQVGTLRTGNETEIVAAVDEAGQQKKYIIADITTDEAWVSVTEGEALILDAWC